MQISLFLLFVDFSTKNILDNLPFLSIDLSHELFVHFCGLIHAILFFEKTEFDGSKARAARLEPSWCQWLFESARLGLSLLA